MNTKISTWILHIPLYLARNSLKTLLNKWLSLVFICILSLSPVVQGGELMGLFNKKKEIVYPFSGFEGQILYEGKPAAGAKITRKYNQMDRDKFEETITADDQGRFKFESIAVEFKAPLLAAVEYMSYQDIFVEYNQNEYHIWTASKSTKPEYTEFGGVPVNAICELTNEPEGVEIKDGLLVTSCRW